MAKNNRVFTSFAVEDATLRNLLVGQARNARSPFEFVDMSVKEPWDEQWKTNCRTKIKGCDGLIILVTKNTTGASGALWELQCAQQEGVPTIGIYGGNERPSVPALRDVKVVEWTWDNIKRFVDSL